MGEGEGPEIRLRRAFLFYSFAFKRVCIEGRQLLRAFRWVIWRYKLRSQALG